ncbi:PD-(D/E)XK nuclease family protein [Bradyrhizobium sp. Ash2021]|uniref:PD-(D/E)XK nuclease family protein n=1 Tax=Bradyrhizobium sp. Ash2021 TaxID=2954771 RepID=UPI0028154240|nr:PD-(D/E)XK nuclease family protein [Bradyrhizobium sp. Ash2021]WMT76889.1 PD-(D/E)XK nuclease family protein [Bradyrhizobium sp. Ash2021]
MIAISGLACWRDWHRNDITTHHGLITPAHPRLTKLFERPLSATSFNMLLRDPIRFVWRYGLGWKAPEDADEPVTLDPNVFGTFVHAMLRDAIEQLEGDGGIARAGQGRIEAALADARGRAVALWENAQPVPPDVIWRSTTSRGHTLAAAAPAYGLEPATEPGDLLRNPLRKGQPEGRWPRFALVGRRARRDSRDRPPDRRSDRPPRLVGRSGPRPSHQRMDDAQTTS